MASRFLLIEIPNPCTLKECRCSWRHVLHAPALLETLHILQLLSVKNDTLPLQHSPWKSMYIPQERKKKLIPDYLFKMLWDFKKYWRIFFSLFKENLTTFVLTWVAFRIITSQNPASSSPASLPSHLIKTIHIISLK